MSHTLKLFHFMPDKLNLYGDIGNVIALKQRAKWHGIDLQVESISDTRNIVMSQADLFFIGGGSDREQSLATAQLEYIRDDIKAAVEDGMPALTICGGYQFLGDHYITLNGEKLKGLQVLDFYTESKPQRLTGNIVVESPQFGQIVAFENHGGRTYHHFDTLGDVIVGYGNNDKSGKEGLWYKNLLGTYMHGPILPKNPQITDYLLKQAMERKGLTFTFTPLDDSREKAAQQTILTRLLKK